MRNWFKLGWVVYMFLCFMFVCYNRIHIDKTINNPPALSQTDVVKNIKTIKKAANHTYSHNVILRDLSIAQAILESRLNDKPSSLAYAHNNLFGIKGNGTNGHVTMTTKECIKHKCFKTKATFAVNKTLEDSFKQHDSLLHKANYSKVVAARTFQEAALEIKKAHYATDPNYTKELMRIYKIYVQTNVSYN